MEQEKHQSNAETFSKRSGTLISTQFVEIGQVKQASISIVLYKDLMSGQEEKAIRFEYEYHDGYSDYPDTKVGVLDRDELEGLIKSINIMRNNVFTTSPSHYTEVNFTSRSGFRAGCFSGHDGWSFYIKLSEYDSNSTVWLKKEDTATILDVLTRTKERLLN